MFKPLFHFYRRPWLFFALALIFSVSHLRAASADRPNFLWVTSEDNSPYLGCYGDPLAKTPHLDKLAAGGVRYRHAFANAPVCSASRSTLITGMHASSLGMQHHRSKVAIPERFLLYPEVLRGAGYYCTNNFKTDYNLTRGEGKVWDESSKTAHYRNRAQGQPFFAVFNFTSSHESQVAPKAGKTTFRAAPEQIQLPPYHPDTPEIRRDWANYYDQITLMDSQVGQVLEELEKAGLSEDTIVFYYGDHGGALPGGKRSIQDAGTRVPLIIRIPEKWAAWRPAPVGGWSDQLVSFVDLPATVFSLAGISKPDNYEGQAFLGAAKAPARDHVYLFRGRMDERYDTVRSVRDGSYRYVRNYSPHRPQGQHYSYPFEVQPSMGSWFAEFQAGRCNAVQAAYWQPKQAEELYHTAEDRFETRNLATDAAQDAQKQRLRELLKQDLLKTRDSLFIPEGMYTRLAEDKTIYDYCQSQAYPMERLIALTDVMGQDSAAAQETNAAALRDPEPLLRYWAATHCLVLREKAAPAKARLLELAKDAAWPDVRIVAAETLGWLGEAETGLAALSEVLATGNTYEKLAALNTLDAMVDAGHVKIDQAQALVRGANFPEPAGRIQKHLLESAR